MVCVVLRLALAVKTVRVEASKEVRYLLERFKFRKIQTVSAEFWRSSSAARSRACCRLNGLPRLAFSRFRARRCDAVGCAMG